MPDSTQPDVVLIHCHDLGRWLPVYGMPQVPAPNISNFATESVVFDNAHSASPLCSPARGALFTGTSPYRNGIQGLVHNAWRYREGVLTAPEHLRPLGYHSALIGLQHENVDPTVLGFDECPGLGFIPRTNQVVEATERWLGQLPSRNERKPVFLTVGTWEVHRPWGPEDYEPADPSRVDVPGFLPDNEHTRRDIAAFYGAIAQFDAGFGRLLTAIDSALDRENTMIVFTTDHGAAFPRAKSTLYDAGTGVSFIVRLPSSWDVPPHRVKDLISHMDLVPTLLELAGATKEDEEFEGESLVPLLRRQGTGDGRVIFTSKSFHDTYDPKRAARSKDYVYIRNYEPGPKLQLAIDLETSDTRQGMGDAHLEPREPEELYDRRTDPSELVNVIKEPDYQDIRSRHADLLDAWLEKTGDPIAHSPLEHAPARSRHVDDLPAVGAPDSRQAPATETKPAVTRK
ncbi:sulfatase [Arthrobacter sp. ISL-85]|uniref:sulfatase family protein n=1 Tax=Arthrobacter sp. ISL-85 TaxID=2819115 RepID=UPI001BECC70C|nr:sulfatase [Arthrobacter sp. ISL-85]MBT2568173.1 sulfatase [Arthrobacter sp. ISL-85]